MFAKLGIGSLAALWGAETAQITTRHLATMRSGVPDYDTASPDQGHGAMSDSFRAQVYATPGVEYGPATLLNESWVAIGKLHFTPGDDMSYSSSNFVLLGLLLAQLSGSASWDAFDQATLLDALPPARRQEYSASFAAHGTPSNYTPVHGFDRTSYNGADPTRRPGTDVWKVSGVYAGWTAADVTATSADIARFSYDMYGSAEPQLLAPAAKAIMTPNMTDPSQQHGYGFATFRLGHWTGQSALSPYYVAYGHLGATYGYDSVELHFPALDVSLAVATDIETDTQAQPSEVVCFAYNAIIAALTNTSEANCSYDAGSYFGSCDCGNTFRCDNRTKTCSVDKHHGSLSKDDCERTCH
jgi:CubicO group peptidase (beta-lactamase class C family)